MAGGYSTTSFPRKQCHVVRQMRQEWCLQDDRDRSKGWLLACYFAERESLVIHHSSWFVGALLLAEREHVAVHHSCWYVVELLVPEKERLVIPHCSRTVVDLLVAEKEPLFVCHSSCVVAGLSPSGKESMFFANVPFVFFDCLFSSFVAYPILAGMNLCLFSKKFLLCVLVAILLVLLLACYWLERNLVFEYYSSCIVSGLLFARWETPFVYHSSCIIFEVLLAASVTSGYLPTCLACLLTTHHC